MRTCFNAFQGWDEHATQEVHESGHLRMHLEATWGAPIADHRAQAGLIGELASLLINLAC